MKKFSDIYLCHLVYSVLDLFSKVKFNEMLKYKSFIFEKAIDILNNYTIENSKWNSEEMQLTHKCKNENHKVEMAELQQFMKSCVKFS